MMRLLSVAPLPQGGTGEEDRAYGVFADDDESVVLTGFTDGAWSDVSSGETDFAAVKLDGNGTELWRWQVIVISCTVCMRR